MTRSDMLTAAAVRAYNPLKVNDREVTVLDGDAVKVRLHGRPCLALYKGAGILQIDGATLPTRKSCRLVNAVLAQYGPYRAFTRDGKWYLKTPEGEHIPFTDKLISVPVNA